MPKLTIYDRKGKKVGTYNVEPTDFAPRINKQLLHDAVVMYQANERQGSHQTKSRGMVAGSTKKMYRQKGTGNARAGSKRSGIRRGGGHIFAKVNRDYGYRLPRKALQTATRMALAAKVRDEELALIFRELQENMPRAPSLLEIDGLLERVQKHLNKLRRNLAGIDCEPSQKMEAQGWLSQLEEKIRSADIAAKTLRRDLNQLYRVCQDYTEEMDFTFLFDRQRKVFHLGYNL